MALSILWGLVIFLEILQFFEKKNLILTHTKNNNLGGK
jgi:hypothetical protein